jgi:hypothetical protein
MSLCYNVVVVVVVVVKAWIQDASHSKGQATACGICGVQSDNQTGFSPSP